MTTLELSEAEISTIIDALRESIEQYFKFFKGKDSANEFLFDDLEMYADTIKLMSRFYDLADEKGVQ